MTIKTNISSNVLNVIWFISKNGKYPAEANYVKNQQGQWHLAAESGLLKRFITDQEVTQFLLSLNSEILLRTDVYTQGKTAAASWTTNDWILYSYVADILNGMIHGKK